MTSNEWNDYRKKYQELLKIDDEIQIIRKCENLSSPYSSYYNGLEIDELQTKKETLMVAMNVTQYGGIYIPR